MNWRLASRLSVITMALLVVVVVALLGARNSLGGSVAPTNTPSTNQSGLQGTDLDDRLAPDFHLKDQFGKPVSLSQFKGKPVVLTFMYTHCPDVCPLTAEKLHTVMQSLGPDAAHVGVIAISTDPRRDTTSAALMFSKTHRMQDYWHFLVGSHEALSPIWESYSVDAEAISTSGTVTHSTVLYVIDEEGRERVLLDNGFTPAQLTANLKILLKG
ncbi:MAG: SCO family protein [Chloroflexota bacterium]|nr:SCO family protein [Chloroflexota bacterium]